MPRRYLLPKSPKEYTRFATEEFIKQAKITPKKLNVPHKILARLALIAPVETAVAIEVGASVQPLIINTPVAKINETKSSRLIFAPFCRLVRKVGEPLTSAYIKCTTKEEHL